MPIVSTRQHQRAQTDEVRVRETAKLQKARGLRRFPQVHVVEPSDFSDAMDLAAAKARLLRYDTAPKSCNGGGNDCWHTVFSYACTCVASALSAVRRSSKRLH